MTTHEHIQELIRTLRAKAVKFEHHAHLGQPLRSADAYRTVIAEMELAAGLPASTRPASREGLAAVASDVLRQSKRSLVNRDELSARLAEILRWIDQAIARAKATQ